MFVEWEGDRIGIGFSHFDALMDGDIAVGSKWVRHTFASWIVTDIANDTTHVHVHVFTLRENPFTVDRLQLQ